MDASPPLELPIASSEAPWSPAPVPTERKDDSNVATGMIYGVASSLSSS